MEEMPEKQLIGFVEAYSDQPNLTVTIRNEDEEYFDKEISIDILNNVGYSG